VTVILKRSGAFIGGPPHTASRWVSAAVAASGIPAWNAPGHQFPGWADPAATYIRHPVSWLGSMYRNPVALTPAMGWYVDRPRGQPVEQWVTAVLAVPGSVGRFFRQWALPGIRVARFESLRADLRALLEGFGEQLSAHARTVIDRLAPIGAGPPGPPWPAGLADAVCAAEEEFVAEFYPEGAP